MPAQYGLGEYINGAHGHVLNDPAGSRPVPAWRGALFLLASNPGCGHGFTMGTSDTPSGAGRSGEETAGPRLSLGRTGEEAAARFLRGLGLRIAARNWRPRGRYRHLELDLVAMEDGALIFVEVKTRQRSAEEDRTAFPTHAAFTARKQRNMLQAARLYLTEQGLWNIPCRFDLICVERLPDGRLDVEQHRNVITIGHTVDSGHASWQPW
jgi:putative endonuclease